MSASLRVVNRGTGERRWPSKVGGSRHTPPRPLRSFSCSMVLYSTSPYGGSVTTPCIESPSRSASQARQSAWKSNARPDRTAGCRTVVRPASSSASGDPIDATSHPFEGPPVAGVEVEVAADGRGRDVAPQSIGNCCMDLPHVERAAGVSEGALDRVTNLAGPASPRRISGGSHGHVRDGRRPDVEWRGSSRDIKGTRFRARPTAASDEGITRAIGRHVNASARESSVGVRWCRFAPRFSPSCSAAEQRRKSGAEQDLAGGGSALELAVGFGGLGEGEFEADTDVHALADPIEQVL